VYLRPQAVLFLMFSIEANDEELINEVGEWQFVFPFSVLTFQPDLSGLTDANRVRDNSH
jgi:hypothetical protein